MQTRVKALVEQGLVKAKRDPKGSPLTLYEYAPEAMGEKEWSEELRMCRGLVLDDEGKIIARPFEKFWNLDERPETKRENLPFELPQVSEKLDGSLAIILYDPYREEWRAVTRGSWDNQQTRFVQERLDKTANNGILGEHPTEITLCCELIAPWNRVVIPYEREELVLLAVFYRDGENWVESRSEFRRHEAFGIDRTVRRQYLSVDDARALYNPARLDEGWVFRYSNGLRVKLKYDEYVRLHRIITGFSARRILESLTQGKDPLETTAGLHDDFLKWYEKEVAKLRSDHAEVVANVDYWWREFPPKTERKETALRWQRSVPLPILPLMFRRLDGGDWKLQAWKLVEAQPNQQWFKGDQS